ncbi:hypothetical protein KR093_001201 [Drosophila rubida]|uniref:Uncharacterized protein n=1 Tax=Drosophila rubida TaxID=30044 RepID=A0AAD4KBW2_9MUSC|nr:hypothetical protein KR093_001201 [Drosophila rubida]
MCMPYLGKLFSGGHRRRNNGIGTPRHSLAPTPQQSNATIQTTNVNNTTMVVALPAANRDAAPPLSVSYRGGSVVNDLGSGSVQNTSGSVRSKAAPVQAATSEAVDDQPRPSSWWEFFGINRSKKGNANAGNANAPNASS